MPRKRMLWPDYFNSNQLAQISLQACRTFEGFWCWADDRGRMLYDPDQLWGDVWLKRRKIDQVTVDDVEDHLAALVSNGQLCRYEVGGGVFLHAISWDEHQKVNHPTPSKLPPCEVHQAVEWPGWWRDVDTATDRWRQAEKAARAAGLESLSPQVGLTEDSRNPNSQCSSVQVSSDQASSGVTNVKQFVRKSQERGVS